MTGILLKLKPNTTTKTLPIWITCVLIMETDIPYERSA